MSSGVSRSYLLIQGSLVSSGVILKCHSGHNVSSGTVPSIVTSPRCHFVHQKVSVNVPLADPPLSVPLYSLQHHGERVSS